MGSARCPNCGHGLVILREEHQPAGTRRVWLRWLMCSHCRHVALDDWGFIPESDLERPAEHAVGRAGKPGTTRDGE